MICTSAFDHKIGNAAHYGASEFLFSQVEETTVANMDNWQATPRDNVLPEISNGHKFKMANRRTRPQQK